MKKYYPPFVLLQSATINMTVSQLGELGFNPDMAARFKDWWEANYETVLFFWPKFEYDNPSTWPTQYGFNANDPYSWEILLDNPPDDPFEPEP